MSQLRIFSYLPNPRIWKATIAGRLCGVEIEVRGDSPEHLADWLWDFDAHPLSPEEKLASADLQRSGRTGFKSTLYKTLAFLDLHPFGTVPAAFSPDGRTGIFESNSIMRTVARLGAQRCPLYGSDPYTASRIDSFLDASLVFARDTQLYVLALRGGAVSTAVHASAALAFDTYLRGIERALTSGGGYIVAGSLSLADICFAAELSLLHNENLHGELLRASALEPLLGAQADSAFPRATRHFATLRAHPAFAPDLEPYLRRHALPLTRQTP